MINPKHFYSFYEDSCKKFDMPIDTFENVLMGLVMLLSKVLEDDFRKKSHGAYSGQLCKGPHLMIIPLLECYEYAILKDEKAVEDFVNKFVSASNISGNVENINERR
jgi:hypothetical protein